MVDEMIKLDRRIGPWPLRVWGLVLNFFGNALAIYGAIGVIRAGSRWPLLVVGLVLTISCLLILAKPGD